MKTDEELEILIEEVESAVLHSDWRRARKLLRSIEISALREAREILIKTKSWDFSMESEECENPALPELDKRIRDLELQ